MSEISATAIGTLRYAPKGAMPVRVYNTATSSVAGLGQSAIACAMKLK